MPFNERSPQKVFGRSDPRVCSPPDAIVAAVVTLLGKGAGCFPYWIDLGPADASVALVTIADLGDPGTDVDAIARAARAEVQRGRRVIALTATGEQARVLRDLVLHPRAIPVHFELGDCIQVLSAAQAEADIPMWGRAPRGHGDARNG
jgi:hypothetical protein